MREDIWVSVLGFYRSTTTVMLLLMLIIVHNRPEKPLKWLSEFLAHKSGELEKESG